MASGALISIASHVEPECLKREMPELYKTRYTGLSKDTQSFPNGRSLSKTMMLTANEATPRATGTSEVFVQYSGPPQEQWMRGNTRRFGNKGLPWVANSKASCGGAPGVSDADLASWSTQSHRCAFSDTSDAAKSFVPRLAPGAIRSLPAIRCAAPMHA